MKKIILSFTILFIGFFAFAQTNSSVPLSDEVYNVLNHAESKGYCERLFTSRPYTERYILIKLDEISEHLLNLIDNADAENLYILTNEYQIIENQKERFVHENGFDFSHLSFRIENGSEKFPVSLEFNNDFEGFLSTGIYTDPDFNSTGYEAVYDFNFVGDILRNVSYNFDAYIGLTKMPLTQVGNNYEIGTWLYDTEPTDYGYGVVRTINTYKNYAMLPYSYKKFWDGQAYYLSNVGADGLEGWPFTDSMCFGMNGELRASFFDSKLEIGMGRTDREWVAMDNGASLVLNSMARPFLAFDARIQPFKSFTFSTLTGVLEYPNQEYINANAWNYAKEYLHTNTDDAYYFQNAFSLIMIEVDFKYLHFDFGSASVWPKRFEFGYLFPFIDNVIYQNNIGDNDNLALFGDFKFIIPRVVSFWISGYLDEMPKLNPKLLFEKTRYMFAFQAGTKVTLPFLPFATLSVRYTKVEPYCYTHHSINYTPWYNHYISESYTNNGISLGYYLPPNSDEFFLRVETHPSEFSFVAFQYQLIRHGANFGSRAVRGSDLYSELPNKDRDSLYKYFLKDGCYEWSNIFSLTGSYNLGQFRVPVVLTLTAGFIYDWFTDTDAEVHTESDYHRIDTNEYPTTKGVVFNIGFKAFL